MPHVLSLNRTLVPEDSGLAHNKKPWVTPADEHACAPQAVRENATPDTGRPGMAAIIYLLVRMHLRLGL
jgi:hypothetical protein